MFPELKESEDERIRNEIIDHLVREVGLYPGVDRKEHKWLRWLEKQKELFESGRGLYYYDGEKTTYLGYPTSEENLCDFVMSQQEKQKEQKLIISAEESLGISQEEYNKIVDECIYDEQKPAKWSEEDENAIRFSIDWLSIYRDRHAINQKTKEEISFCIDKLKSLCPTQYCEDCKLRRSVDNWKPSEEQMKALYDIIPKSGQPCTLQSLYHELQKL